MLWVAISPDEIELPLAVEDSATKLAKKMKTTRCNIINKKNRGSNGKVCGYKVVTVENE